MLDQAISPCLKERGQLWSINSLWNPGQNSNRLVSLSHSARLLCAQSWYPALAVSEEFPGRADRLPRSEQCLGAEV